MISSIFLLGMKHTGKTTLGKELANLMGRNFLDLDDMIVSVYRERYPAAQSVTCRSIYSEHGRQYFQELEAAGAVILNKTVSSSPDTVAALGGGIVSNPQAMEEIVPAGFKAVLTASPEELFARIERRGIPPFLSGPDPYGAFIALYQERSRLYSEVADCIIDCSGLGLKESLSLLITTLKGEGFAW